MDGILLSPLPRDALYFGKVLSNYLLLLAVVLLVFLVFGLFFSIRVQGSALGLALIVALGVLGFVAVSTLFSAFTGRSRMGETILPVLVFPLLIPVVIYGATSTFRLFQGRPWSEVAGNARILAAFAILSLAVGGVLFRFVVEE